MKTKFTHYVEGKHFKDSGMLRDIDKELHEIDGDIELSTMGTVQGITLISENGKKTKYIETYKSLIK